MVRGRALRMRKGGWGGGALYLLGRTEAVLRDSASGKKGGLRLRQSRRDEVLVLGTKQNIQKSWSSAVVEP